MVTLMQVMEHLNRNRKLVYMGIAGVAIAQHRLAKRMRPKKIYVSTRSEGIDDVFDWLHMTGQTDDFMAYHIKRIENRKKSS